MEVGVFRRGEVLPGAPSGVLAARAVSAICSDHAIHDGMLQRVPSRKFKGVWFWGGVSVEGNFSV